MNGQKVWTSGAHYSDWGLLLARTEPRRAEAPRHHRVPRRHAHARHRGAAAAPDHGRRALQRGVPHRRPRPGRVPVGRRRRRLARRQHHAVERAGAHRRRRPRQLQGDRRARAARAVSTDDPVLRQELAQSYTRMQLIKWLGWRARSRKDQGLGPEASVLKLAASRRQELDGDAGRRAARHGGAAVRRRRGERRLLAEHVPQPVEQPHRRRHRAGAAQRDRRARARAAVGRARRQGRCRSASSRT